MNKFSAKLFLLATLSLGCLAVGTPAMAEKTVNVNTDNGPYVYSVYQYPSYNTSFFFYQNSYVEFDVKNGKFWMIEAPKFNLSNDRTSSRPNLWNFGGNPYHSVDDFTVTFYSPEGKVIGSRSNAKSGDTYSFPRCGENYDKVRVRIESRADRNIDAKFIIWEAVNPVMAKPLEK
ncbi:hypothetical protein IJT10_04805 [bacterium]|nr:hypothetical protein [bacterium]